MWLIVVLIAQFLNAIVFLFDKYLLGSGRIDKPALYAFYVGMLGIIGVVLIPFGGLSFPGMNGLLIDFLTGGIYILACWVFYQALKVNEASRVVPVVGSFSAVFVLILSTIFLGEALTPKFISAFLLLLAGSVLISLRLTKKREKFDYRFLLAVLASFIFSVFYILTKYIYLHQPFISGFIWSRFGGVIFALFLLFIPSVAKSIFKKSEKKEPAKGGKLTSILFLSNQLMGGTNFILINWAISMASVALVNAMQGVQYAFIFLISLFLVRYPRILVEEVNRSVIIQKIIAILLIGAGIFLINF
ncbi:MAG: EamA family transporter [Patescibacteria group bacterium]|jgi:drug/metabolite transporter (DMT)-like permease